MQNWIQSDLKYVKQESKLKPQTADSSSPSDTTDVFLLCFPLVPGSTLQFFLGAHIT